jgi:hypothetical protein
LMASFHQKAGDRGVLATVRVRAIRRLGRPLLLAYAALLVLRVSVVLRCVFWTLFGVR